MKKKDENAFLRSIYGASPIKKKNRIEKKIPKNNIKILTKNIIENSELKIKNNKLTKIIDKPKSLFVLEKSPINKRLKKGKIPVERKIDFHGLSVLDAEELFLNTIISCYKKGIRCLLFITGKGVMRKSNNDNEQKKLYYGKIRREFFLWIARANLQKYILSVEQAGIEYGADGAFFVYLRKKI